MKILYIITQGELGGAQRYVLELANEFSNNNEIFVANGAQGDQWLIANTELKKLNSRGEKNIAQHQFKHLIRNINIFKDIPAFFEIKKYIKKERPDIIHVNSTKAGVLVALAKGKVPSVYTVHGWVFNEPMNWLKRQFYIFIEKISCRRHNKIIVLGNNNRNNALRLKIADKNKFIVIPHGIKSRPEIISESDHTKIKQNYRAGKGSLSQLMPLNTFGIITVANLYKTKGLEYLIKAVNKLDNVRLVIYGDGPEKQNLKSLITDNQKIILAGREGSAQYYILACDLFVLPSLKEGLPYAILEAMEGQAPIITTTVGEIPNILENEKTALLVKPADSAALANAIKRLIDDPTLRITLATNAKKRLADFSFETMIEKHEQVYFDLTKLRNK